MSSTKNVLPDSDEKSPEELSNLQPLVVLNIQPVALKFQSGANTIFGLVHFIEPPAFTTKHEYLAIIAVNSHIFSIYTIYLV